MQSANTVVSSKSGVETETRKPVKKPCRNCGLSAHGSALEDRKNNCPAFIVKCSRCFKVGHFMGQCFFKGVVNGVETGPSEEQEEGQVVSTEGVFFGLGSHSDAMLGLLTLHKVGHRVWDSVTGWREAKVTPHGKVKVHLVMSS